MSTGAATRTFDSLDPATGEVVGTFAEHGPDDVAAAVRAAGPAARAWDELGWDGRRARLDAFRGELARRLQELVALVHAENGKPRGDAVLEITAALEHLAWAARHAERVLRPRRVNPGIIAANHAALAGYRPFGVVAVIGPWNYPVFTPLGSIGPALAAGNAVVFKPSEHTPAVGALLARMWADAVPDAAGAFTVLTGHGATGAALCRAPGVGKVAFTGSTATGRRVMAACAENLVPVLMECGGKDAFLVDADADVARAADAALWGAMQNAGQTCLGIERAYVVDPVHDRFVDELVTRAAALRPGTSYGPMTMPGQELVVRAHVADAVGRGATAVTGGVPEGRLIGPTILLGVPEDAPAIQEETFGPTLTVTRVASLDEAIERANGTRYGLGGAVWTGSRRRGLEAAARLRSGMVSVNGVLAFASVPSLALGGVGDSGFGRTHGADGLREFSRATSVTRERFPIPLALASFTRTERTDALLARLVRLRHARAGRRA